MEKNVEKNVEKMMLNGIDEESVNAESTLGFVKIEKLGGAQQVTLATKYVKSMLKIVEALCELGWNEVVFTVANGQPIVIGSKGVGIAVAPVEVELC